MKVKVAQSMSDSVQLCGLQPTRLLCPWTSPGKNIGLGSHSLPRGIVPTQGLNLGLLHCRQIPYSLSRQGSPVCHTTYKIQLQMSQGLKCQKTKFKFFAENFVTCILNFWQGTISFFFKVLNMKEKIIIIIFRNSLLV